MLKQHEKQLTVMVNLSYDKEEKETIYVPMSISVLMLISNIIRICDKHNGITFSFSSVTLLSALKKNPDL